MFGLRNCFYLLIIFQYAVLKRFVQGTVKITLTILKQENIENKVTFCI